MLYVERDKDTDIDQTDSSNAFPAFSTNPPRLQAPVLPQRHRARVLQPHAQVAEPRRTAGGHAAKEETHHAAGDDVALVFFQKMREVSP